MRIDEIDKQPCSVARTLAAVGDAWSILIVREALYGVTRFSDFVERTGAQRTVVSARLKGLVGEGILERVAYSDHPSRFNYVLTEKGRDLAPALFALAAWGDRWLATEEGRPIDLVHTCGHHADATVVCGHCDARLDANEITATAGPGYPRQFPLLAPAASAP